MHFAGPGVTLAFNGRDKSRVKAVAAKLRAEGARVEPSLVDVVDKSGMEAWIKAIDSLAPLDLVIANAGIGTPDDPGLTLDEKVKAVYDVNVCGVFNTVNPALELMLARGGGQIAIVSSIAAYMGALNSPAYSSSKAAVKAYGEGLRARFRSDGIRVSVICPGVIRTRMTESYYKRVPGWRDVDFAVKMIAGGLERDRGLIAFPWYSDVLARWLSGWPEPMRNRAFGAYIRRSRRSGDLSAI
jgi:NAD(P)-dependent dehydrogenase (short-subunit alcohol dehydrogenase family)